MACYGVRDNGIRTVTLPPRESKHLLVGRNVDPDDLSFGCGIRYISDREISNYSASWSSFRGGLSYMAQMPDPVPTSRIFLGLSTGARNSLSSKARSTTWWLRPTSTLCTVARAVNYSPHVQTGILLGIIWRAVCDISSGSPIHSFCALEDIVLVLPFRGKCPSMPHPMVENGRA